MCSTRTKKCARSFRSISDSSILKSRRGKSRLHALSLLSLPVTFITWSPRKRYQVFTIHLLSMSNHRHSMLKLNNISSLHSKLTISGNHPIRRRLSSSVHCPLNSKKLWSKEKYSIKKLSISDIRAS